MKSFANRLGQWPIYRRAVRAVLLSEAARAAVIEAVRQDNVAVKVAAGERWIVRDRPFNPRGSHVVSYNDYDPLPVRVGSYSGMNDNSYLMPGSNHRIDTVTSWVFHDADIPVSEQVTAKGPISVGSDVLVSFQALVMSGVSIGHGAVVAARAVVTKDVPPYAIVAGVPAKVVGWRFEEPVREALLRIAWWDWPHERVVAHARQLTSTDVGAFVRRHDPAVNDRSDTCDVCET